MADWKSALAALGAGQAEENSAENRPEVERKKRVGTVYSTNPDFQYEAEGEEEHATLPKNQQKLRISMERAGRGGKSVTLVRGFVGSDDDRQELCKLLKQKCGVGGSVKEDEIIIQGDHRQRLLELLKREEYSQTK